MFRILVIVLGFLLAGWRTAPAAPWELPAGVKTLAVNGYPMAFVESGAGQTVVLVHGAGTDYRSWKLQMESPPPGLRLIAVSLRHHYPERWNGKEGRYSIQQHAEDLAAFVEALGVGAVHVVAHSLGGIVALRMAQARPEFLKKLVLMEGSFNALLPAPKPAEGRISIPAIRKTVAARFEQGDIDGGLELWVDRETPGAWKVRSEEDRQRSRDNAWTLISLSSVKPVTCADVAGLTMPVLLIQGEKTSRRLANIVEATRKCLPSAEHVIIPGAGHAMHVMNPAAFEAALVKFLSN